MNVCLWCGLRVYFYTLPNENFFMFFNALDVRAVRAVRAGGLKGAKTRSRRLNKGSLTFLPYPIIHHHHHHLSPPISRWSGTAQVGSSNSRQTGQDKLTVIVQKHLGFM